MRNYKISLIRILAMISIMLCHIFQAKNIGIAFWLNVGVQIFLFMSGFLYGKKEIKSTWLWLKKQYSKILIPYYIYVILMIIFYIIFARDSISFKNIISLLLCFQIFNTTYGLNHFWFIPIILMCYLITPFLQKLLKNKSKLEITKLALILFIMFYVETFAYLTPVDNRISNIICYIIGYFIAYLSYENKKQEKTISILIVLFAIIFNMIKISIIPDKLNILLYSIFKIIIENSHILLGMALFIVLYKILKKVEVRLTPKVKKIIDFIDKYCFYIYITHHSFILGPFSIINLTFSSILNIIIIICCIVISSYMLSKLTDLVKKELIT